jgi:hypothetical protein
MIGSRLDHRAQTAYLRPGILAALLFVLVPIVGCGPSPSSARLPIPVTATSKARPPAPSPVAPSATAPPAEAMSHLALGLRVYQTGFVTSFVRPGDILGSGFRNGISYAADILSSLSRGERMLMFTTIVGLTTTLDALTVPISYLGYDLEQGTASPAESQDPIQAVKTAQQIAHSRGLQLVIGPTGYFVEKYGAQMARYTDVFIPQAKYYQANLSPAQYEQTMRALFTSLKQANPQVKIFLDISPSPKGIQKTPPEMMQSAQSVLDLIDGVWITYRPAEAQQVLEFVKLMGRQSAYGPDH